MMSRTMFALGIVVGAAAALACGSAGSSSSSALPLAPTPQPVAAGCDVPPVAVAVPVGERLQPGQMVSVAQATAIGLASGPLRLTLSGEGRYVVRSSELLNWNSQTGEVDLAGPRVVFWQGPAVLTLEPSSGHTLSVAVCTP